MNKSLSALLAVATLALGACTTLSGADRALLTSASSNAEAAQRQAAEAQATAERALQAANTAQADAAAARQSAADSAAAAKAAAEKADRMFQRSLRK